MFKLDLSHVFGVMSGECGTQQRTLLARLQSPRSLGSLLHRGSCPAQCHRGIALVFDVAADASDGAHHVLDDVGACQAELAKLDQG
jgi:hypothetical protein